MIKQQIEAMSLANLNYIVCEYMLRDDGGLIF